jgi:hypothetical protein
VSLDLCHLRATLSSGQARVARQTQVLSVFGDAAVIFFGLVVCECEGKRLGWAENC